ncbi:hypothetical protein [Streptomyces sp. SID3343]|uniref:hypothetical protein n=1 Tax=Streptomyces sp. SID3343 TaxID=2690260 RepID=UPI001925C9F3|nr:hypothetical protein [Streptomyces sp. SID3343]
MIRVIGTMGDKLLGLVLQEKRAGACVPEHGQFCVCRGGYRYIYSCNGPCVKTATRC